tara:strand:+ start:237 stop:359 length:123 start_codon:yes stop_codon:yes gene_type:complete
VVAADLAMAVREVVEGVATVPVKVATAEVKVGKAAREASK